jgi:flagella basal body P-ring formation protein FlgA
MRVYHAKGRGRSVQWISRILFLAFCLCVSPARAENQRQTVTQERVESFLRRYLLERVPWRAENVEFRVIAFPPVAVRAGQVGLRILKSGLAPGLNSFLVAVDVEKKEEARVWVKTDTRVYDQVVVSSFRIAYHSPVEAKDVRVERRDISAVPGRPFSRVEEVVGQQASRAIDLNEILTERSVVKPPLIRRGSTITLLYETGAFRVETPGIAEEAGKAGDFVQVKNTNSGKMLRGLVLDARLVKVN